MCSTKNIHKISEVLRKVTEDISNSTVSTVYADDCRYGDNQIRIPLTCKVCIWRANCCLPLRLNGTQESGHVMHAARRSFPSRLQVYTVLHMSHMNAICCSTSLMWVRSEVYMAIWCCARKVSIEEYAQLENPKISTPHEKTLCLSGLIVLVRWMYVSQWFN